MPQTMAELRAAEDRAYATVSTGSATAQFRATARRMHGQAGLDSYGNYATTHVMLADIAREWQRRRIAAGAWSDYAVISGNEGNRYRWFCSHACVETSSYYDEYTHALTRSGQEEYYSAAALSSSSWRIYAQNGRAVRAQAAAHNLTCNACGRAPDGQLRAYCDRCGSYAVCESTEMMDEAGDPYTGRCCQSCVDRLASMANTCLSCGEAAHDGPMPYCDGVLDSILPLLPTIEALNRLLVVRMEHMVLWSEDEVRNGDAQLTLLT